MKKRMFCLFLCFVTACGKKGGGEDHPPPPQTPGPQGYATFFDDVGGSGACGVPGLALESQDYVALNVQDTPGDYSPGLRRPITDQAKLGLYANGANCGRWVHVEIGQECEGGVNDGAQATPFCRGGTLKDGPSTGASLNMLVTDSCQDNNAWCRDSRNHLDLHTFSLLHFIKNGQTTNLLLSGWSNPKISWNFIPAPNYQGDLNLAFYHDAQKDWLAIVVSNLPNGIHGVDAAVGSDWKPATMLSDNGQVFVLPNAKPPYRIRVRDADDKLVNNGRVYVFGWPEICGDKCLPYVPVAYTTQQP